MADRIPPSITSTTPIGPDVDLARIAATTPGMVGADLA